MLTNWNTLCELHGWYRVSRVLKVMQSKTCWALTLHKYVRVAYLLHWANGVFKKGQGFPGLNYAPAHEWPITPNLLNLGIRWRWVATFKPRVVYVEKTDPGHHFDKRLGRPRSQCGHSEDGRDSCPCRKSEADFSAVQPLAYHQLHRAIATIE
jgi:hypothetical protein